MGLFSLLNVEGGVAAERDRATVGYAGIPPLPVCVGPVTVDVEAGPAADGNFIVCLHVITS